MKKIIAHNIDELRTEMKGRKNCTIYLAKNVYKELDRLSGSDVYYFNMELKTRNIQLASEIEEEI